MPIRVNSFMGKFGWWARQHLPNLASNAYLKLQFSKRRKMQDEFGKWFLAQEEAPMPQVVNIETINRCNSECEFCSANIHSESRPFARMSDELYHSIIDQLADWGYEGHLTLYGNNEPLLDTRIVKLHKYAREKLPNCFIFVSTNGLLLTLEKICELQPYVDQIIINNYGLEYKLHDNLQEIYDYVKCHPSEFEDVDIQIQIRYIKETLTNRAGSAPNKQATEKVITEPCLLPYTDLWIPATGVVGLCCCDNLVATDFGDLSKIPLKEVWNSEKLTKTRELISMGRQNYPFCKHCDFIDAGFRMEMVQHILAGNQDAANRLGGEEKNSTQVG